MRVIKHISEKYKQHYYQYVLRNGFNIYLFPKKGFTQKYGYFYTRYGSLGSEFLFNRQEIVQPLGIAHFLEHKIFEDESRDIFQDFAKLGANVNAYTNFESTVYYFSTNENLEECIDKLSSFVTKVYLTDENVEKEKGIISQEIRMYEDDPSWRCYFNGLANLYESHPIKNDIAGSVDSIMKISKEDLLKAYENFYSPKNMAYLVVGDFDNDQMLETIIKSFPDMFMESTCMGKVELSGDYKSLEKREVELDFGLKMPMFDYFIKVKEVDDSMEMLKLSICRKIALDYLFGKGGNLYQELYDKDLINQSFGAEFSYGTKYSYFAIGGESKNPQEAAKHIKDRIQRAQKEGLDYKHIERIIKKLKGRTIQSLNSVNNIGNSFVSYEVKGISFFDAFKTVDDITPKDVYESILFEIEGLDLLSIVR